MTYTTKSPVLLLMFNRPDATRQVFDAIKHAAPPRLYIAADGPRAGHQNDVALCQQTKNIVEQIDWLCKVVTLYRTENLGCKEAVSSAIDWFFDQEEEGIILEDDCVPHIDFFLFCDLMLERYRFDARIRHIGGSNLQLGKTWGNASYYFSNLTHVWGWAGWRRIWQSYDKTLGGYQCDQVKKVLDNIFSEPIITDTWLRIFEQVKSGRIDTWDYQLTFINFFNNSLSVIPNVNLISNIGFRTDATHTKNPQSRYAALRVQELGHLIHPTYIVPQKEADYHTLSYDFDVERIKQEQNKLSRRFKRWVSNNKRYKL